MKRSLKMNLTSILCFIAIVCTILGMGLAMTNATVRADEQVTTFAMEAGVNLKMADTGMRFKVKMDDQTAKDIKDNDDVTLKFIIAPAFFFDAQTDGQYLNMSQKLTVEVDEAKIYTGADGYKYANGCVYSMKAENLKIDYTAIAVIETVDGTPKYATQADTVRNMYQVVNSALVATEEDKILDNDEVQEVLATYSFMGTADYPIIAETAEQMDAISDRAELFNGRTVKVEQEIGFVEDVEIYKEGRNSSKVDAEFVKTSDSDVAYYEDGKVISGEKTGRATLTFKKVIDGIEYLQDITVTVKPNPVVVLTAEDVEVDTVALDKLYYKTRNATGSLYVDDVETSVSKIKWSLKSGSEFASVTESGAVTGIAKGTAVITASYTDESGVTTSVDSNVTVNSPIYYGQHSAYAHDGLIVEMEEIQEGVKVPSIKFSNLDMPSSSAENQQLVRFQVIPSNEFLTSATELGPRNVEITIEDAENPGKFVSFNVVSATSTSTRSGIRTSAMGNFINEFFGRNNGNNNVTANAKLSGDSTGWGFTSFTFGFRGEHLTKTDYNHDYYMIGLSVSGSKIYIHNQGKTTLLWDMNSDTTYFAENFGTLTTDMAWESFNPSKVNIYVRASRYMKWQQKDPAGYIYIDTIAGTKITAQNANDYIAKTSWASTAYNGSSGNNTPVWA